MKSFLAFHVHLLSFSANKGFKGPMEFIVQELLRSVYTAGRNGVLPVVSFADEYQRLKEERQEFYHHIEHWVCVSLQAGWYACLANVFFYRFIGEHGS